MKSTIFEEKKYLKEKSHFPEIDIHEIVYTSRKRDRNKELVDYPHCDNDIAPLFTQ